MRLSRLPEVDRRGAVPGTATRSGDAWSRWRPRQGQVAAGADVACGSDKLAREQPEHKRFGPVQVVLHAHRSLDIKQIASIGTLKLTGVINSGWGKPERFGSFSRGRMKEPRGGDRSEPEILEATAAIVAERGVGALTLGEMMARAGVSRRVFYECFDDRDACLLAAFDLGVERAAERIAPAYAAQSRWRDAIRAGLADCCASSTTSPRWDGCASCTR